MIRRREFLKGSAALAGAGLLPGSLLFNPNAFAAGSGNEVLVYLFLRGGIDGLHLLTPIAGPERVAYESRRSSLLVPEDRLRPIDAQWGFHPRLGGATGDAVGAPVQWLHRLFEQNRLAVIQGSGMATAVNRSHFDTQAFIDLGTPGNKSTPSGWLTRAALVIPNLPEPLLSTNFAFASTAPRAVAGDNGAFSVSNAQEFRVDGFHWSWNDTNPNINGHRGAHEQLFPLWLGGGPEFVPAGRTAAEALEFMRQIEFRPFDPDNRPDGYQAEGGAIYPSGALGTQLRNLAQLIKLDTGIVAATLDFGGWDTHEGQGIPNPGNAGHFERFGNLVEELSRALHAFYTDLAESALGNLMNRVNVVVLSEFGRRIRSNGSGGTDHGYGNLMLALGGRVNGGLHGQFPGLDDASLFEGQDLAVTTDYRQVLSELLVDRMGVASSDLQQVFPGLGSYQPVGVFQTG
ncbi:MAG: hypothetical protein CVV18_02560 [Gammaproteobacteria bacterium HGW-Gammaproteobacteria-8]|nr:MAG: hypothetical protein CVV18_02560 [Gammaproteobacteria bacterium HGW-Gammaproteobacteria-8]